MKRALIACLLGTALLAQGCLAQNEQVRADLNNVKHDTYEMTKEIGAIKAALEDLKQADKNEAIVALRRSQTELLDRVNALDGELKALRGLYEEDKHFAGKAAADRAAELASFGKQVEGLKAELSGQAQRMARVEESVKTLSAPATAAPQEPPSPEKAYDRAYSFFLEEKYPDARKAFSEFLKLYPEHVLTGNAQFWIAETHYKEKDYESAILAYEEVIKKHPESRKVPGALLKQGLAFLEMRDQKVASALLKELVEKHPDTEEARIAKSRLADMQAVKK